MSGGACSTSHDVPADVEDAGPDAFARDSALGPDSPPLSTPDAGPRPDEPPPGSAVCGGRICGSGEECCLLTGACVPLRAVSCVAPTDAAPDACVRQSDCADGEVCEAPALDGGRSITGMCAGVVGRCFVVRPPAECGGGTREVCGCDGRTYGDVCAASRAGVSVSFAAPCGEDVQPSRHESCVNDDQCRAALDHAHCDVGLGECVPEDPFIACGVDAQCPEGQACCGYTGACYDAARSTSCGVPPEGTSFPCSDDRDCARWDGAYWRAGGGSYCDGPDAEGLACGTSGGCRYPPSACPGTLSAVCGCDGSTYQNACEAQRARVRIAHDGGC